MLRAYAGGVYPFCRFFLPVFFFLFSPRKMSLTAMNWCWKTAFLRLLFSVIMSKHFMTCTSCIFCIHLYLSKAARDLFLFYNSTADSRGIKKRFSFRFIESLYFLRSDWSHCFKPSNFTSQATGSFSFIYIKIHVIIFFANT